MYDDGASGIAAFGTDRLCPYRRLAIESRDLNARSRVVTR